MKRNLNQLWSCACIFLSKHSTNPCFKTTTHKNPKGSIIKYPHVGKDLNMNAVRGHPDTIASSALYSLHINQVSRESVD